MNNNERYLLRYVCDGDIKTAQNWAKTILESTSSKTDESFRNELLEKLERNKAIEIPYNLKGKRGFRKLYVRKCTEKSYSIFSKSVLY